MVRVLATVATGLTLLACADTRGPIEEPGAGPRTPPPTPAGGEVVITEADSGEEVVLATDARALLRLDSAWVWAEPIVEGDAVELLRVDYLQDPGFLEWEIMGVAPGAATIRSVGEPASGSPDGSREFEVTITVVA